MDGFGLIWASLFIIVLIQCLCYITCHQKIPSWIRATYEWGKFLHDDGISSGSFTLKLLVPKRYFTHFYWIGSIFTLFTLSIFVPAYNQKQTFIFAPLIINLKNVFGYLDSPNYYTIPTSSIFLSLSMLSIQTLRRLYECLFISKFSQIAKIHLGHYLLGIFFYILVNITIISDGSFLNSGDYSFQMLDLLTVTNAIGICTFCWASLHQHRCHNILAQLRNGDSSQTSYGIPTGDWFNYVACPHYLSEIVIYLSIGFILSLNHQSWWFLLAFISTMLSLGAIQTSKWYRENFSNYPEDRRAIIPNVL